MPVQVTHNNDGHFYTIDVDIAKEGAEVFDLSTYFKARVADNHTGLRVRCFWQGQILNTVGKKPRVEGVVGQYSFKKGTNGTRDLVMSPDASAVASTGDVNDCEPGGYATYYFPGQMFPQDGLFKGSIGLVDDSGETAHYTSVDIWFKVYPQAGGAQMGRACDFYINDLDAALVNAKEKMRQAGIDFKSAIDAALQDLRTKYQQEVQKNEDMSAQTRTDLERLSNSVGAIQAQINAGNVVTLPKHNYDIAKIGSEIEERLAKLQVPVETLANADAIKAAYPNGEKTFAIAGDTGHKWIYYDSEWHDGGDFTAAGLPKEVEEKLSTIPIRNLIPDPEFSDMSNWTAYGKTTLAKTNVYKGHGVIRLINSKEGLGGAYSKPFKVSSGDQLSFSLMKNYSAASSNSNLITQVHFYKKETDAFGQAVAVQGALALNPDNVNGWQKRSFASLVVPDSVDYARIGFRFEGDADTSTCEISEPLLVIGNRIGAYDLDDMPEIIEQSHGNLFPDPEFQSTGTVSANGLTVDRSTVYENHRVITINASGTDIDQPYLAIQPIKLNAGGECSLFTQYAYSKPKDGTPFKIIVRFYSTYPTRDVATALGEASKEFQPANTSYTALSFNKISIPKGAKFARIFFYLPKGAQLWILNPIFQALPSTVLPNSEVAAQKPRAITFINPYYTVGKIGSGNGTASYRPYLWIRFDKVVIDYSTEQRTINWKDWISNSATNADDYSENVFYVDIGPKSSDPEHSHFDYVPYNDHLEVRRYNDWRTIPLISWDATKGFYGIFIDQADKDAQRKRGGRAEVYSHLTSDILAKLAAKEQTTLQSYGKDDFVFGVLADDHRAISENDPRLSDDYSSRAFAKVSRDLSLDANLNLGDTVLSVPEETNNTADLISAFKYIPAKDWIYVQGNHDRHIVQPILTEKSYNNIVNRCHQNDPHYHFGNSGSYFYVDFEAKKVRVIVLDDYDIGADHDEEYNHNAGFRQNQLEWLVTTALNTPDGWQALVLVHQSPAPDFPENDRAINSDQLMQILKAYVEGTSVHITARDVTYNDGTFDVDLTTNFTKPGTIVAVMSGHAHNDYNKLIDGINYIQSCCGYIDILLYHNRDGKPAKYGNRDLHTWSAICFDVGILNTKTKTLLLKRFGFGKDRVFNY